MGRTFTLIWAAILVGAAMLFQTQDRSVVVLALSIASLTYGGLLGTYLLGGFWPRTREVDVMIALVTSLVLMSPVVLGGVIPGFPVHWLPGLAWPWYVPLGTGVTVGVGILASMLRKSDGMAV